MLAAYGSGASKVSHDEGKRILNIDIGGGTTKLAVVENGNVIATAAVHIGGRLQVVDEIGRIVRLDPAGRYHARQAGFSWSRGDVRLAGAARHGGGGDGRRAGRGARDASDAARHRASLSHRSDRRARPHRRRHVLRRRRRIRLRPRGRATSATWAAGSGRRSAAASTAGALPWPLLPAGECIRATALGASEYSVQLSGNTSYISKPGELLPRRNLQVLQPAFVCEEVIDADAARRGDPRAFHRLRPDRGRGRGGAGAALARRAVLRAHLRLRRRHPSRARHHHRAPQAGLRHARRRRRADARARSCAKSCWSRARSWPSTAWCCAISTTSISAASACRPTPCRSRSSRSCSARIRAAAARASASTTMIMITGMSRGMTTVTIMSTITDTTTTVMIITTSMTNAMFGFVCRPCREIGALRLPACGERVGVGAFDAPCPSRVSRSLCSRPLPARTRACPSSALHAGRSRAYPTSAGQRCSPQRPRGSAQ